ncbi:MAG: argininosuccinate synthase [Planctomycetes bacterium]|nr:argininosuccinate synthase [Planctomycetota bacterium]
MKVLLAYSGSLNSTIAIHWLSRRMGLQVVTYAANLGYGEYFETLGEHALECGAVAAHVEDLRRRFLKRYVLKALQAHARYEAGYMLSAALGRAVLCEELVRVARENGCTKVSHGAGPKANDHLRFQAAISSLDPALELLAPARDWPFRTRADKLAYVREHGLPLPRHPLQWSGFDGNLWGISQHNDELQDLVREPLSGQFQITADPQKAPDRPETIRIAFRKGVPVSLDGKEMPLLPLVTTLNLLGGKHGVGRLDVIEDRVIGFKSREVYEAPAATILYTAHEGIEDIVLGRELREMKARVAQRYGVLLYFGAWFSHLREALDGFVRITQNVVDGTVMMRLHKGSCTVVGRESPQALHDPLLASNEVAAFPDSQPAGSFIPVWSRGLRAEGLRRARRVKEDG